MTGKIYLPPPPTLRDHVAGMLLALKPNRPATHARLRLKGMTRRGPSRPGLLRSA